MGSLTEGGYWAWLILRCLDQIELNAISRINLQKDALNVKTML